MRQVPHYLFISNGRISRHFQYYFSTLSISYTVWQRSSHSLAELHEALKDATHILILINDDAIENFIQENLQDTQALRIHFSGSLNINSAYGAHPLMTFNQGLYSLEEYQNLYFIVDDTAPAFNELLPGIQNPHVYLQKKFKEKYHALCVLSGNFSCMLWQKLFSTFENEFNLPAAAAYPYLKQQMKNIQSQYQTALTGPLVRDDHKTISKNLSALTDDAFQSVYQSFVACYQLLKLEGKI